VITATVRTDTSSLIRSGLGRAERIARMAGSSALSAMKAEASRRIRERKAMKVAMVNRAMTTIFPSSGGPLVWVLRASSEPMPVAAFNYRQTKQGVSVEINRGQRKLIRGAFVATMKSGHTGVFYRTGRERLPIDEAYTTRVSDAFKDATPDIERRGVEVFVGTMTRLLAR
jgi:hypothetical protein